MDVLLTACYLSYVLSVTAFVSITKVALYVIFMNLYIGFVLVYTCFVFWQVQCLQGAFIDWLTTCSISKGFNYFWIFGIEINISNLPTQSPVIMTDHGNFLLILVQCRMMAGQARQLLQRHLSVNEVFDQVHWEW
jgi:hypothetical protein